MEWAAAARARAAELRVVPGGAVSLRRAQLLIGGKRPGFVHDHHVNAKISINELWGAIAQAFGYASTAAPLGAPVAGFWTKPSV